MSFDSFIGQPFFRLVMTSAYARANRLSGWRWGGRTASGDRTGEFRQFSLAGNRVAALHLATRVFLAGNHIGKEQRDKEQERTREKRRRNLRNLAKEYSREAEEGEEEKISMKINVKPREIERETKHLFTTVSFQVIFSFLI